MKMLRPTSHAFTAGLLLLSATLTSAQAVPDKKVTSAPLEMKGHSAEAPAPAGPRIELIGEADQAPYLPAAKALKEAERMDRLATTVRDLIVERSGSPSLDLEHYGPTPVVITLAVNAFGEVKDIRVHHEGDAGLNRSVVTALYALPRLEAATLKGTDVASELRFTFPYAELFKRP